MRVENFGKTRLVWGLKIVQLKDCELLKRKKGMWREKK